MHLGISGACLFSIDGVEVGVWNDTVPGDGQNIRLVYQDAALSDTHHTLVIYPADAGMFVQFDYVMYTCVQIVCG